MNLISQAKDKLYELFANTAENYGVSFDAKAGLDANLNYNVTPIGAQRLEERISLDASWFYKLISIIPVIEQTGDVAMMSPSGLIGGRTDTSGNGERATRSLYSTESNLYACKQTNWDTHVLYKDINAWALNGGNFNEIYTRNVRKSIARSRMVCGWHGTSAATTTDIATYPLLQDVNIGWLHRIRNYNNGSQYSTGVVLGVDIPNLDVMVMEARQKLPIYLRERDDLIAMVSSNLIVSAEAEFYAQNGGDPRKKITADMMIKQASRTFGALPTIIPPDFPDGTVLVTYPENLQLYYQLSGVRRQQLDVPRKDRVEEYLSGNEDYAVGEYLACGLIDGITIG
jgi:P2 family phage major capsid protein